ncbi:hypothetical protein P0136_12485 [Lentisphaerota bacterium ZTH]|nr:hypothetical protein JYG24_10000 [Lentisphaerota bacterium]WET06175.1 hypothetical protein P0136_12485 [Lentisphaerota bacterium ZTH]
MRGSGYYFFRIAMLFLSVILLSCHSQAPKQQQQEVSGKYWHLRVPSAWKVAKAQNGYQLSNDNLPGVIQISSYKFNNQRTLRYFINNLPEIFIAKQNISVIADRKYTNGKYSGIRFEYLDDQKLSNIAWAMMHNNTIIFVSYLSATVIPEKDKEKVEKLIREIDGC